MKRTLKGYFKGFNKETDRIEFTASTNAVDRQGESIDPNGWDLSNINKNLPLLWAHNDRELPIGKVVEAHVDGNSLIASVEFAHKINDFAKQVYDLVVGGFLNAVSVGFMPKTYDNEGNMVTQELLELSVVNVPANQEALRSRQYQAFTKSLETEEPKVETKSPMCRMDGESKEQCVARKIPEIMRDDPNVKQDQAIAMAENMCSTMCKDLEAEKKEGRIISEKNRNTMRIAIDSMRQASDTLSELLNTTEPPAKKGGVKVTEQVKGREKRILKSVQLMDKIGEAIIHELKEGGE